MKICMFIAESASLHGPFTVAPVCRLLAEQGHDLQLVVLREHGRGCVTDAAGDKGYLFQDLGQLDSCFLWKNLNRIQHQFGELICDFQPDLVHTWGWQAGIAAREGISGQIGHVHTIQTMPSKRTVKRLQKGRLQSAERHVTEQADALIYATTHVQLDAENSGIGNPRQHTILYNGLRDIEGGISQDARRAFRKKLKLSDSAILVTQIAPLSDDMGHRDLLKAVTRLSDVQALEIHMCFVGDGPLEKKFMQEISRIDLSHRVHFAGRVSPRHLPVIIRASDVIAHCAGHAGLPAQLPMAMRAARPVVCWNHGCAGELITHDTGIILEPGDLPGLTESLRILGEVDELRRQLGQTGHNRFKNKFELGPTVDHLKKIYDKVITSRRA